MLGKGNWQMSNTITTVAFTVRALDPVKPPRKVTVAD